MAMVVSISLWTALPAALLLAGVCALAIWAARQPDQTTALINGLTKKQNPDMPCGAERHTRELANKGEDRVCS
jgi:hypothetical protein